MSNIVITTCTNRKSQTAESALQARNMDVGDLDAVAKEWVCRLSGVKEKHEPSNVYCGRSYLEAVKAASVASGPLYVISAGLGLVAPKQKIPAYDLTTAKSSSDHIQSRINSNTKSCDWWRALNRVSGKGNPIAKLVKSNSDALVIIGLSSTYLEMIESDLGSLDQNDRMRLRIVGIRPGQSLPEWISPLVMPYDDRLDGPDTPIPGTRGDFAQRALRHFCETISGINNKKRSLGTHRALVLSSLEGMRRPKQISRRPVSDKELIDLVSDLWDRANGHSSKMLRILRDEECIACEQGRFSTLFKQAKEIHGLA